MEFEEFRQQKHELLELLREFEYDVNRWEGKTFDNGVTELTVTVVLTDKVKDEGNEGR
jgi:hypothetical protein